MNSGPTGWDQRVVKNSGCESRALNHPPARLAVRAGRIFSCLCAALVSVAAAATGNLDLLTPRPEAFSDLQLAEPSGFWGRFHHAYDERAEEIFADHLHPLKVMELSLRHPADSRAQLLDRTDRAVQNAFLKSFEYSGRDASFGLPLMNWLETRQDALGSFLADSVDAVEEESVSPFDLAYGQVERAWWKSLAEKRAYRFGLRPFGSSPYAFLGLQLREAGRTLLLGNVRYYFQNFSDHRFELSLSLAMPGGIAFDLGTFYQFGRHVDARRLVVKVFKPIKHGGVAHLGVEVQRSPVIFAGISMPL